jgi:hypothetical protein
MKGFFGWCFVAGGVATLVVNGVLSPIMLRLPPEEIAASNIFLARLSLAALSMLLLLIGLIGAYQEHVARAPRLGALTHLLAFIGTALLFAHEWSQVFFVHPLARMDADALPALEAAGFSNLYNIEAIIVLSAFAFGWIAFSISLLAAGTLGRLAPALIVAGFFAAPIFAAVVHGTIGPEHAHWGAVAGNLVLSVGWIIAGRQLSRA